MIFEEHAFITIGSQVKELNNTHRGIRSKHFSDVNAAMINILASRGVSNRPRGVKALMNIDHFESLK